MSYTSKQDRVSLEWLTTYIQMRRSHCRPRSAWGHTDDVQSSSVQHRFVSESNNKRTSTPCHSRLQVHASWKFTLCGSLLGHQPCQIGAAIRTSPLLMVRSSSPRPRATSRRTRTRIHLARFVKEARTRLGEVRKRVIGRPGRCYGTRLVIRFPTIVAESGGSGAAFSPPRAPIGSPPRWTGPWQLGRLRCHPLQSCQSPSSHELDSCPSCPLLATA